ncbi:MAG: polymorphic toxin type 23 domain-containing protein [Bacteroidota bacterium]
MLFRRFAFILLLLFALVHSAWSQQWLNNNWGVQAGASISLGSHMQKLGFRIQAYGVWEFAQFNIGNQTYYNFKGLGQRKKFWENKLSFGTVFLGGKRNTSVRFIFDGLMHQTKYDYALGYNYIFFTDNAGTSQQSGGFGLHVKAFSLLIENDIFAGKGRDRFRTSHASFHYFDTNYHVGVTTHMWTGETNGTRLKNTPDSIYQTGYKDLRSTPYGTTSHGILSVTGDYLLDYGNRVGGSIGIDHERVRHVLQNKIMHDKPFIPKKWRDPNVNYPMLDKEGHPVHHPGQERPGRFYYQFGLNRSLTF